MPTSNPHYWFPAKRYGWGWGVPSTWQGWLVLLGYFVLLVGAILTLDPKTHTLAYVLVCFVLTAVMLAICWWKGEPPRWRWGSRDQERD